MSRLGPNLLTIIGEMSVPAGTKLSNHYRRNEYPGWSRDTITVDMTNIAWF
jgi:hypothetical protein